MGTKTLRYIVIGFDFKRYPAHRLAWLLMTGEWPDMEVDHINHDKRDNRWVNLRLATKQQNAANVPARANSTSGIKGVSWHKLRQKWVAHVTISGKHKHLGLFESKEDAAMAYSKAAAAAFGEYAFAAPGA